LGRRTNATCQGVVPIWGGPCPTGIGRQEQKGSAKMRRGFTLIELLVVIAIMTVLIF
jgi:prepilin-type N-terminal cleavage/methylation domain-containing protein